MFGACFHELSFRKPVRVNKFNPRHQVGRFVENLNCNPPLILADRHLNYGLAKFLPSPFAVRLRKG